jgi:hypothetical protein
MHYYPQCNGSVSVGLLLAYSKASFDVGLGNLGIPFQRFVNGDSFHRCWPGGGTISWRVLE